MLATSLTPPPAGASTRAPALTTCVDCGGAPCLASACAPRGLGGVCQRDAMVAAAVSAGFADVDVPLHCERRRDYLCESEPARRRFRCALVTAPAPRWNSSVALAAPQLYPPSYMTGRHTPQYYSTASEEAAKGIMYDKRVVASRVNGVPFYEWRDGGQKKYFLPQLEYVLNDGNWNGTSSTEHYNGHYGEAGWGLSSAQWSFLLSLLYINGSPQAMQQMLLPLAIIAMGSALLPGKIPETDTDPVPYPDGKTPTKLTKFKPSWYPT